jgi:hypothetical protein
MSPGIYQILKNIKIFGKTLFFKSNWLFLGDINISKDRRETIFLCKKINLFANIAIIASWPLQEIAVKSSNLQYYTG